MTPDEAVRMAKELKDYLTELFEDEASDDVIADKHLETAAHRADDLLRSLTRWNRRMQRS